MSCELCIRMNSALIWGHELCELDQVTNFRLTFFISKIDKHFSSARLGTGQTVVKLDAYQALSTAGELNA